MNNQIHGLCSKCISKFDPQTPPVISYTCQKCNQNDCQFIFNDQVLCFKCYQKENISMSIYKKATQIKTSNLISLVPKSQMTSSMVGFLSRTGKVIKKLEKILTSCDIKSNQIIQQLSKKSLLASNTANVTWQKLAQKCNKTSSLIYFFVGKEIIFGSFHTQAIKITSQNSFTQDAQSGLFLTQRFKYDLNVYKTNKNLVKYSQKSKSISFGDPVAFEILFNGNGKQITIKSGFERQLKWDYFFIYKA